MRLSEVLELPELKERGIVLIGTWKTGEKEFAVLAHRDARVFPIPKIYHLVEIGPGNSDPELVPQEIRAMVARFSYFEPISRLPAKSE